MPSTDKTKPDGQKIKLTEKKIVKRGIKNKKAIRLLNKTRFNKDAHKNGAKTL